MKLLPKKEVQSLKQKERKTEIDEGMALINQVEELRKLRLAEEENLLKYRNEVIDSVKEEVSGLVIERNTLKNEISTAIEQRNRLLEPLDTEWKLLDIVKEQIIKDKQDIYLEFERLKSESVKDKETKKSIIQSVEKARKVESDARKLFSEAVMFKENAENEYSMAKNEHDIQTKEYGKRLDEVELLKQTYQNGINVNAIDEKKLKDWEDDLIIRETQLMDREATLEREIKRNVNS